MVLDSVSDSDDTPSSRCLILSAITGLICVDVDRGTNSLGGLSWALVSSISWCEGAFGALGVFALVCMGTRVLSLGVPWSGDVKFSSSLGANVMSFGSKGAVLPERLGSEGVVLPELLVVEGVFCPFSESDDSVFELLFLGVYFVSSLRFLLLSLTLLHGF